MKFSKTNILITCCLYVFFLENIKIGGDFGFDFRINLLFFIPISLLLLLLKRKLYYYKSIIIGLFIFLVFDGYQFIICSNSIEYILKYNFLIITNIVFSYSILNYCDFNVKKIVDIYYKCAFIFSLIGIIQFISYFIHFKYGYDYSYLGLTMGNIHSDHKRIQSIFEEPSYFVYTNCLAFFISLSKKFNLIEDDKKMQSTIIILSMILTFSTIAYIIMIISMVLIVFSKYKFFKKPIYIVFFSIIICVFTIISLTNDYISKRIFDTYNIYTNPSPSYSDVSKINLSTYATFSNYKIMMASLQINPITGYGFFNYKKSYYENLNYIPDNIYKYVYRLNDSDGNSLGIRIIVELGIILFFVVVFFVLKYRMKFSSKLTNDKLYLWVINNGIFVLITARFLRQGHYTNCAFLFFILLYFYTYKLSRLK